MARNVLAEASEHIIEGGNREAPAPPKEQSKHRESIRGVAMAPSVISAARASRSTILTLRPRCDAYSHRFSIVWHILLSPFVSYIGKAMDRNRLFNQDLVPDMFCLQFGISDRWQPDFVVDLGGSLDSSPAPSPSRKNRNQFRSMPWGTFWMRDTDI